MPVVHSVALLDLSAQHEPLREELETAVLDVVASGRYIGGPVVADFEAAFAGACGARRCVGVANGTDALSLALRAADIGAGYEVITTASSFVATAAAIIQTGATPVLVDPDPATGLLDAGAAAAAIGPRTGAIVPVHLYGQPVDLVAFRALADRFGLFLLEDACQAHGAADRGQLVGSAGDAAAFSFYPGKNLGALGDAGAVTTNDDALADRIVRLRDHGRASHDDHVEVGSTARLDPIQAAALLVKLPHLAAWNERRRGHAAAYDGALAGASAVRPLAVRPGVVHAYHQYVVRASERRCVRDTLAAAGIASGIHYPVPLHRQPALIGRCRIDGPLPVAEALAAEVLSLPVHPCLRAGDVDRVLSTLATLERLAAAA